MSSVSESEENTIGQAADFAVVPKGLTFIEQLQIISSKPCTKTNTPYLIGVNQNEHKALLTKAACKCWDCETCSARNARVWIACMVNGARQLATPMSLLTLTAHRYHRKEKSVPNLRQGWKKLYNRIQSNPTLENTNIYYVRVWEQHEEGTFHNHIIINVNLGTRWAKTNASGCGMGYMADWRGLDNVGLAAGYVAKYTLKNANLARGGLAWPKGLRRIEKSRNWPNLPEKEANLEWSWNIANNREFQLHQSERLAVSGYQIIDMASDSVV